MGFDGSFQTGSTSPIGFPQTPIAPPVTPYTPAPPRYEIAKVNGRQGALEFPMGPNSSIFLGDTTNENRIWMVMTDSVGNKKIVPILGTIDEDDQEIKEKKTIEELDKRLKRVEELLNEQRANNSRSSKSKSGPASTTDAGD